MGRPQERDEPMINTAVSLPTSLRDWLKDFSRRRVIGRSLVVERALEEYRDRHDSEHRSTDRPVRDLAGGTT